MFGMQNWEDRRRDVYFNPLSFFFLSPSLSFSRTQIDIYNYIYIYIYVHLRLDLHGWFIGIPNNRTSKLRPCEGQPKLCALRWTQQRDSDSAASTAWVSPTDPLRSTRYMAAMATLCSEALRLQEQLAREANWLVSIWSTTGWSFWGLKQVESSWNRWELWQSPPLYLCLSRFFGGCQAPLRTSTRLSEWEQKV